MRYKILLKNDIYMTAVVSLFDFLYANSSSFYVKVKIAEESLTVIYFFIEK